MPREYVLTERLFKYLSKRCGILLCARCEKPLKVNDKVISNNRKIRVKRYHKQCYESMFIDV